MATLSEFQAEQDFLNYESHNFGQRLPKGLPLMSFEEWTKMVTRTLVSMGLPNTPKNRIALGDFLWERFNTKNS